MTLIVRQDQSAQIKVNESKQPTKPTLPSVLTLKKIIFESLISCETHTYSPKECVQKLRILSSQIGTLRHDLRELQKQAEQDIENLPFYYFLQKLRFWLVKQNLWCCSTDGSSREFDISRSVLGELDKRISHLVHTQLKNLKTMSPKNCEESFEIASFYDELGKLEPTNLRPQEGLANWLLEQKVYQEAHSILSTLAQKKSLHYPYQVKLIQSLIGKGNYKEAKEKISDLKLKITLDEQGKPCPLTSSLHLAIYELDLRKAECLASEKNYEEALSLLHELLKKNPGDNLVKHKIIACMVKEEIDALDFSAPFDEKNMHYFLACPKQMFASLDEFKESTFSKNSLISEVEFWVYALFTQPKLYNNKDAKSFILEKIKKIIDAKQISKELLIEKLQSRLQQITEEHEQFEKKFYTFTQKCIDPQGERQKAILTAQAKQLESALHGEDSLTGSIGLIKKKEIAEIILKNLDEHPHFQDRTSKAQLIQLANRVESQGYRITSCVKSYLQLEQTVFRDVYTNSNKICLLPSL